MIYLEKVIKVISILILASLLLIVIEGIIEKYGVYEYIDLENKKGTSRKCIMNKKGLFCDTEKGLIEVKQYGKRS